MNNQSKQRFMTMFNEILNDKNGNLNLKKDFLLDQKGDEVDQINQQKEQSLKMRLDQRNILFLKKVEEAKQKILEGTYGECEDCGENISQKRLLARPTASLCINCQEEKEREEFQSFKNRRDLKTKQVTEDTDSDGYIMQNKKITSLKDISFESVVDL